MLMMMMMTMMMMMMMMTVDDYEVMITERMVMIRMVTVQLVGAVVAALGVVVDQEPSTDAVTIVSPVHHRQVKTIESRRHRRMSKPN